MCVSARTHSHVCCWTRANWSASLPRLSRHSAAREKQRGTEHIRGADSSADPAALGIEISVFFEETRARAMSLLKYNDGGALYASLIYKRSCSRVTSERKSRPSAPIRVTRDNAITHRCCPQHILGAFSPGNKV